MKYKVDRILAIFDEAEEMESYCDMIMEDPEIVMRICGGSLLTQDGSEFDLEKLKEDCGKDYELFWNSIENERLMDALKENVMEVINAQDNSDIFENFNETIMNELEKYLKEEEVFMIVDEGSSEGNVYEYQWADSSDLAEVFSKYCECEMALYLLREGNFLFEAGRDNEMKTFAFRMNGKLSRRIRMTKEQIMQRYSQEISYLNLNSTYRKAEIIQELLLNEFIDPFYEENVRQGIFPSSQ